MGQDLEQFLSKLKDPTTDEGALNIFYGLWGGAQVQKGFKASDWVAVLNYIKALQKKNKELQDKLDNLSL